MSASHATRLSGSCGEQRVEDGVGDLVADLVGMAFVHRLGGEHVVLEHGRRTLAERPSARASQRPPQRRPRPTARSAARASLGLVEARVHQLADGRRGPRSACGPLVVTSMLLPCSAASIMMPMMLRPLTALAVLRHRHLGVEAARRLHQQHRRAGVQPEPVLISRVARCSSGVGASRRHRRPGARAGGSVAQKMCSWP